MKYLKCDVCGNVVAVVKDSGVTPECCGKPMEETDCKDAKEETK